jgi:hypothetical protein
MRQITFNPDKFGFYQSGPLKTYSKTEGIELQTRTGIYPEWNFNRSTFDAIDWTIEPSIDIYTLYKERARQIRDAYDYCVIFYSGGSDSHNILNAWMDADCKIDEITTLCYFDGGGKHSYMNEEVTRVALPYIEELKKTKEFKFRLIDYSQDVIDVVSKFGADWRYSSGFYWSPNNKASTLWRDRIDDYRKLITAGKKVCFIWGVDKPKVFYDGKLYFQFVDMVDGYVSPYHQQHYGQGWYDELFYWTPDFPEIPVKQAHLIRRFVNTINDPQFYEKSSNELGGGYNKLLDANLTQSAIKQLVYPEWDPATYVDGKGPSRVFAARDNWMLSGNVPEADRFKRMSLDYFKSLPTEWLYDPTNILKGIKNHVSPKYYIE